MSELSQEELKRIEFCIDLLYQVRFYWVSSHFARGMILEKLDNNSNFVKEVSESKFYFSKEEEDLEFPGYFLVDNFYLPDIPRSVNKSLGDEIRKKSEFNARLRENWRTKLRLSYILTMEFVLNQYVQEGSKKIQLDLTDEELDAILLIHLIKNYLIHPDKKLNENDIEKFKKFGFKLDSNKNPKLSDENLYILSEKIINFLKKYIPTKDFSRCPYRLISINEK